MLALWVRPCWTTTKLKRWMEKERIVLFPKTLEKTSNIFIIVRVRHIFNSTNPSSLSLHSLQNSSFIS